jgi:dodecanoy-ACP synthase
MADSIVVTGHGLVTPLGSGSELSWKTLADGGKCIRPLRGNEWKPFREPRAAQILDEIMPDKLILRDRSLRLGVEAAGEAWRSSGLDRVPKGRIGTTFSSSKGGLLSLFSTGFDPRTSWDFLTDFFPHEGGGIIRERFGFGGPALSFSSACSTGIAGLSGGAGLLEEGDCDAVLAGSTEASIHPLVYAAFQNMGILSRRPEGPAPFDAGRDGFTMGEGSAVLVLEVEESARRRKAPLLARMSGWALGSDGTGMLDMQPDGETIAAVIRRALRKAGLQPGDIGYINAHGTGTRLNDRVECRALESVFGDGAWVSSTKGAMGHLLGAAGSVEAVLAVLALQKGFLPPTANLSDPDPECRIRHVEKGGVREKVDHVLSLSYGFGGQLGAVIFSRI